jgi:ankyrin repeat protein
LTRDVALPVQVIPQVADGGGWGTMIVLTNRTANALPYTLNFNMDTAGGATQPWIPPFTQVAASGSERSRATERAAVTSGLLPGGSTIARWYDFQNWQALEEYVEAVGKPNSPVFRFESAVEAVIHGDLAALESLLRASPELVRSRSTRVTHFDPPVHRATLLHYIAANGVEGYRQKTPENAVAVANVLLHAGAEVDALAGLYGGLCTTMSLLVSSCHPAQAGVQAALAETLLDFGASLDERGAGRWRSPLMTALAFGYRSTAEALVKRGAKVDNIPAAAGLGRLADTRRFLEAADGDSRHRALALAAQQGHADIVDLLLDAGEDPNRYNPDGNHAHSTPLHQAVFAGHDAVVRLLVERGARLDIKDTVYQGTPLGWAEYGGQVEIAKYLRAHGARE